MAKQSTYTPIRTCQYNVQTQEGATRARTFDPRYGDTLIVNKGVVVPHWFKPLDDQAYKDRVAQVEHPEKFVKSSADVNLLSGVLHRSGLYKSAELAKAAILEAKQIEDAAVLDQAINDEKIEATKKEYTVAEMKEILREAKVVFPSSFKEQDLAEKIVELGLE